MKVVYTEMLEFNGSKSFRQRILLSLLTGKPIRITNIRSKDAQPGVRDYEVRFLRLVEEITNGTFVEIGYTGSELLFKPGSIHGGEVEFDCGCERGISYFLEALMVLAPFSKFAFRLDLTGITTGNELEHSIDTLRNVGCRILSWFGVEEGVDFKVHSRGASPAGGGRVTFTCPTLFSLVPPNITDPGLVSRIRGVASTTRVSPQFASRLIEGCRRELDGLGTDVYISSDVCKGKEGGNSPGYSLYLQAESTTGAILSAEGVSRTETPAEEIVQMVTRKLLRQIQLGGMVTQSCQWMVLILMAFSPADVCKCMLGPLIPSTETIIKDIKTFTKLEYKIKTTKDGGCLVSCIGMGMMNFNRKTA